MLARVSKFEARPERLDEMAREGVEHVFWESEQAMDVTEEASYWLRAFSAEVAGGMVRDVERYEIFFSEVRGLAGPES
jgi:hypothetical protein